MLYHICRYYSTNHLHLVKKSGFHPTIKIVGFPARNNYKNGVGGYNETIIC